MYQEFQEKMWTLSENLRGISRVMREGAGMSVRFDKFDEFLAKSRNKGLNLYDVTGSVTIENRGLSSYRTGHYGMLEVVAGKDYMKRRNPIEKLNVKKVFSYVEKFPFETGLHYDGEISWVEIEYDHMANHKVRPRVISYHRKIEDAMPDSVVTSKFKIVKKGKQEKKYGDEAPTGFIS